MSERMSDDAWQRLVCDEYPEDSHEHIVREAERARASEEQKDATIKALADALGSDSGKGHTKKGEHGIPSCNTCCYVEPHHADACQLAHALRLAGRL